MTTEPPPSPPEQQPPGWLPQPPGPTPGAYPPPSAPTGGPAPTAPYQPGPSMQPAGQLAGFWRRFLAYLIDAIILGVVSGIVEAVIGAIVRASTSDTTALSIRGGLVELVLGLLYFGYLWSRSGQSIGYMALGIRLVRADGAPVSFGLGMLRYLLIYLSFAICLIPAIVSAFMIGLGSRKQAIHDLLVSTLVVRT